MVTTETKSTTTSQSLQAKIEESNTPFFDKEGGNSVFTNDSKESHFFDNNSSNSTQKTQFFTRPFVQTKLTIGQPGDKYEQEADSMADQVVQRLAENNDSKEQPVLKNSTGIQRKPIFESEAEPNIQAKPINDQSLNSTVIQPKCAECEEEEKIQKKEEFGEQEQLQMKPIFESAALPPDEDTIQRACAACAAQEEKVQTKTEGTDTPVASSNLESRLQSSKGGGSSLPDDTRSQMEGAFGSDFSGVRVHTDSSAVQMNKELRAQAFAHGDDIYFNSGKYDTNSNSGKHLLAHELTHTMQQSGGSAQRKIQRWPDWADNAASWVADTASSAAGTVADGALWVGEQVVDGAEFVGEQVADGVSWVGDQISAAGNWVMEQLYGAIDTGTEFLNEKWQEIEDFGTSSFDDIKNGFVSLASFITSPMTTMIASLSNMNADLLEGAWNVLKSGGAALLSGINSVVSGVLRTGELIWGTVSGFIDGIFDTIEGLFDNTAFNLLPDSIKSGIRSGFSGLRSLWNRISSFWTDLWERLTSFAREIIDAVQGFIENVIVFGIQQVISMVRKLKELYDFVMATLMDPAATVAPLVQGIAGKISEEGPAKSHELGNQLALDNFSGDSSHSQENGTIQRVMIDGEERDTASLSEVIEGIIYYLGEAWKGLTMSKILEMLWKTVTDLIWPWSSIGEQFVTLWNDDWATAYNSLYMPRNLLENPIGCLHDIYSNYMILLDFPMALWRTLNHVIGLLMGWITILMVLIGAVIGGLGGATFFGVAIPAGIGAGAAAGLAVMEPLGLILAGSIIVAETNSVPIIMNRLFTASQVCEKRQVDIMQAVTNVITAAVTIVVAVLMALLARLIALIAEFLKGASRVTPVPRPVPQPVPAPVPAPAVPAPAVPAPAVPAPAAPPPGRVIPFPSRPAPVTPAEPLPIAAKFENDDEGMAMAQLMSEENEETPSIQTARIDNINPDACHEDDDCENIVVPGFAPQDRISHDHASRNGGVSTRLTLEVTGIRAVSGYKRVADYKGNNIAGFIYEVYENETDYRNSEPIQVATIVRSNDDIHSEERIVSELLEKKRGFPHHFIIKVDQIATERSACSTCYGIIRGNPTLIGNKIYTQSSGIYYIVRYNARNWKQNAEGLRAAYCGTTSIQ